MSCNEQNRSSAARTGHQVMLLDNLSDWRLRMYASPASLPGDWNPGREDAFWLTPTALSFLLPYHAGGVTTEAAEVVHTPSGRTVRLTVQTFVFQPGVQARDGVGEASSWKLRRRLLDLSASRVIVLGQLYTSGDYASDGLGALPAQEAAGLLRATATTLLAARRGIGASLIKDLSRSGSATSDHLLRHGYHTLPVEPVMCMDLTPFGNFEDYLSRLSSKYRVRYRRARGKLAGLRRERLSIERALATVDRLYDLYLETTRGADFNLTPLTPNYLRWLATAADIHVYQDSGGEIVGFTSGLTNGSVYQAHFLGLREPYKRSHHLYHNMLFDLLKDAMGHSCEQVDFGRTATEIKSSIGASANPFDTLLKLRSPLLNSLVPRFASSVFTPPAWRARHPFRGRF